MDVFVDSISQNVIQFFFGKYPNRSNFDPILNNWDNSFQLLNEENNLVG